MRIKEKFMLGISILTLLIQILTCYLLLTQ